MKRVLQSLIAAVPAIPYIMRSRYYRMRRVSIAAYIIGGIGLALAGGMAAVLLLSPRLRRRALTAAKETYGKVNEKIGHLREGATAESNGLVERGEYSTATGL